MKVLLCACALLGCSGGADCDVLAARYAAAFSDAQRCVPGQDTCTALAPPVYTTPLPDGGVTISVDHCSNTCGAGNVNPKTVSAVQAALAEYRGRQCGGALEGCLCALSPDGGLPQPYTCRPQGDGGVCSP